MEKIHQYDESRNIEEKIKQPPYRFEFALEQIKKFKTGSILELLDVGSGDGTFPRILQELCCHIVTVVEPNAGNREFIKRNSKTYPGIYHDIKELPENKLFDVITCFQVLEHLKFHPRELIVEIGKHLERNGLFIFTTPIEGNLDDPDHFWRFNFYDIQSFCEEISPVYEIFFINKLRKRASQTNCFAAVVRKI